MSWSLSSVSVEAKTDDRLELATRDELRELITKYDRSGLQWTDQVIVENWTVPRSHPILTMNTRTTGDDLLAAYRSPPCCIPGCIRVALRIASVLLLPAARQHPDHARRALWSRS
jgi:hypothetical protein